MEELSHYLLLYPSYAVAIIGWILYNKVDKLSPSLKSSGVVITHNFKNPKMEFLYAMLAVFGILLIGQLFTNNLMLKGGFIEDALNQVLIFSPIFLLILIRKHPLNTALFPKEGKLRSLFVGLILACIALLVFFLISGYNIKDGYSFIYLNKENLDVFLQVFAEDFGISVLLYRLVQWIGLKKSIIIVAVLFAAGHIPAMISNGVNIENFSGLIFDTLLGILILSTLYKSKNFLWFWMIHFAMDMTQFLP